MPNQNSTQARLDALSVGDEYAYAINEKRDSHRVKAVVKEIGVHIPGYVTPIGVTVEYEVNGSPVKANVVDQREEDGTTISTIRKDTHVKWLARPWSEERTEILNRRLLQAKDEAYNAAAKELKRKALKPTEDRIAEWEKSYKQTSPGNYHRGQRVKVIGGPADGTEFEMLGMAVEDIGEYGYNARSASRYGVIHDFTRAGNPAIHWLAAGESLENVSRVPDDSDVEREYERIKEETEKALA